MPTISDGRNEERYDDRARWIHRHDGTVLGLLVCGFGVERIRDVGKYEAEKARSLNFQRLLAQGRKTARN